MIINIIIIIMMLQDHNPFHQHENHSHVNPRNRMYCVLNPCRMLQCRTASIQLIRKQWLESFTRTIADYAAAASEAWVPTCRVTLERNTRKYTWASEDPSAKEASKPSKPSKVKRRRGGEREGALKGGRLRTSKGEGEGFKGFEGEDEGFEGLG